MREAAAGMVGMGIITGHKSISKITFISLLCLMTFSLMADNRGVEIELENWFRTNKRSAAYKSYSRELEEIFHIISREQLPARLFFEKLNEGVSKKIRGDRLTDTLRIMTGHMIRIKQLLEKLIIKDPQVYEDVLKKLSLYLSNGLDERILEGILLKCFPGESGRTPGEEEWERFLALSDTLFKLSKNGKSEPEQWLQLGSAIGESVIPVSKYPALTSLYMKGRVHRLTDKVLINMIIDILGKRGGIIQLSNELNRRTRKR